MTADLSDDALDLLHKVYGHYTSPLIKKQRSLNRHLTLEEGAAELGISMKRVRQLEHSALGKLREWCDKQGLELDDLRR